jgi:hypothetical protein
MDGAVIPNKREGGYDGKFRRGVEGTEAGARSVESSYSSNWQLSWTDSRRYPNETEESKTDALGSRAQENFARAEGAMGKDKAGGVNTRAHDEPSSTQQDCCGAARSLG